MINKMMTIFGTLFELRKLRTHDNWSSEQLKTHQAQALTALRHFAVTNSPFYREFYKGLDDAPLDALPILTKSLMMEHFDDFVTARAIQLDKVRAYLQRGGEGQFEGKYEVAATSGSTGNPGIFLFDHREWTTIIASFARAREWAGLRLNIAKRSSMAVVSSTNEKNVSARVGKAANTPFLPTLRLDATDPMEQLVIKLNNWQPEVLVAYASMAYLLSQEQTEGRLHIHPKTVFTSSEVLTEQMRTAIENAWGNVVFNEYASTETATLAAEDTQHHGMHIFEDMLLVENVDANNNVVPPGEYGDKLLVTVLFSRTQPLIRYEISDSVRFAAKQPNSNLPYRVIDGVQGRKEDILIMAGINGNRVMVHPNVFHDVMDIVPNKGWQIVERPNSLNILMVPRGEVQEQLARENLAAALEKRGVIVPLITFDKVAAIPKEPSGKSPLIKAVR